MPAPDPVARLRAICLALPETVEQHSHGAPSWFVRLTPKSQRQFVSLDDHHHGVEHLGFWCPAPAGVQQELLAGDGDRFFRPPYVGHRGWIGMRIDREPDWTEVAEVVRDAWRCVASPRVLALLEQ